MSASTVITEGFGTFGSNNFVITQGFGDYGELPPPPPPPPPVPTDVIRNFSLTEWRRWHRPEDEAELKRLGIEAATAEIIADVAARQAEDLRLDEQQRTDELFRELELRHIRWRGHYLDLLNAQRQELIDREIGERLKLLQSNNERSILLLISQL